MQDNAWLNVALAVVLAAALWAWLSLSRADVFVDPLTLNEDRVALTVDEQIAQGAEASPYVEQALGGIVQGTGQSTVERIGGVLLQALQGMEEQVRATAGADPRWLVYPFRIRLTNSETVNAFALPDGSIFFTQGLFSQLTRQDQIAGVLAHEIGHVVLRHVARQFESQAKGNLLLWVLQTAMGATLTTDVAGAANALIQLGYSREQESQADAFGYVLACVSGFDPQGLKEVFELFARLDQDATPEILRTHPLADRRLDQLQGLPCRFPLARARSAREAAGRMGSIRSTLELE